MSPRYRTARGPRVVTRLTRQGSQVTVLRSSCSTLPGTPGFLFASSKTLLGAMQ
jgi:hypothetical protein